MEYYQIVQSRAYQTVAVLNNFTAGIKVGGITADGLQSQAEALTPLAQTRDDAINTEGASANAEHLGQTQLHTLVVQLPKVAEGELNDAVPEETALIDSLAPVYAIQPSQECARPDQYLSRGAGARARPDHQRRQGAGGPRGLDHGPAGLDSGQG